MSIRKRCIQTKKTFYLNNKAIVDFYYRKDSVKELRVFKNFTEEYKKLVRFFNVNPPKVKVHFVYTRKEMDEHWGSKSKICAMVDNKDPYLVYIFSSLVFERLTNCKKKDIFPIIIHEIAHTFVTQINKRCFAWMNEGVCEYVTSENAHSNVIKKKNWSWFKENEILINPSISWHKLMNYEGYQLSYNLVKYIIKKYGRESVFNLLKIRRVKDKKIKDKMSKILGGDFDKFVVDFEKTIKLR